MAGIAKAYTRVLLFIKDEKSNVLNHSSTKGFACIKKTATDNGTKNLIIFFVEFLLIVKDANNKKHVKAARKITGSL